LGTVDNYRDKSINVCSGGSLEGKGLLPPSSAAPQQPSDVEQGSSAERGLQANPIAP